MKFLDVLKNFDGVLVKENKRLRSAYATLLKEAAEDEIAKEAEEEVEEACAQEADDQEDTEVNEGDKCPECGNEPCTCEDDDADEDVKETSKEDEFFEDSDDETADQTAEEAEDDAEEVKEAGDKLASAEEFFKDDEDEETTEKTDEADGDEEKVEEAGEMVSAEEFFKDSDEETDVEKTDEADGDEEKVEEDDTVSAAEFFKDSDDEEVDEGEEDNEACDEAEDEDVTEDDMLKGRKHNGHVDEAEATFDDWLEDDVDGLPIEKFANSPKVKQLFPHLKFSREEGHYNGLPTLKITGPDNEVKKFEQMYNADDGELAALYQENDKSEIVEADDETLDESMKSFVAANKHLF